MAWNSSIINPNQNLWPNPNYSELPFPEAAELELWLKIKRVSIDWSDTSVESDSSTGRSDTVNRQFNGSSTVRYPLQSGKLEQHFTVQGYPWQGVMLGGPQRLGQLFFTARGSGTRHQVITFPGDPDQESDTTFQTSSGRLVLIPWAYDGQPPFGDSAYEDSMGDMRNSLWRYIHGDINNSDDVIPWADFDEGWAHSNSGSSSDTSGTITTSYNYSYSITLATS